MATYLSLPAGAWRARPHINYFHLFHDCLSYILKHIKTRNLNKNTTYFYIDLDLLKYRNIREINPEFIKIISIFVNVTTSLPKDVKVEEIPNDRDLSILVEHLNNLRSLKEKELETIVYKVRTGCRHIVNDKEIIEHIKDTFGKKYTIKVVDFSKMNFEEQIESMNGCKLFIGCHGAGFVNAYFMEPGTNMLEIFPESFYAYCFQGICKIKNINHFYLHGKSTKEPPITLEKYMSEYNINPKYNNTGFRSLIRDITFTIDINLVIEKINSILGN
jgi:hypothetical protein